MTYKIFIDTVDIVIQHWERVLVISGIFVLLYKGVKKVLTKDDWTVMKADILKSLREDEKRLDILIPLLKVGSNKNTIPEEYAVSKVYGSLLDRLNDLYSSPRSKIENKEEIEMIREWHDYKNEVNSCRTLLRRVEIISSKESDIRMSLSNLIKFYLK
jgi:hypothetical protein